VLVHREGDLELRAHAVHAADEDRLAIFLEVELEEAAEAADLAEDFARWVWRAIGERGFDALPRSMRRRRGVGFLMRGSKPSSGGIAKWKGRDGVRET
jgi:hypothetical protein